MPTAHRRIVAVSILASLWIFFAHAATAAHAQSTQPAVKGSDAYRSAFQSIAEYKIDAARESLAKIDNAAEKSAVAAWLDFIRCRFEPAEKQIQAALDADAKQPLALLLRARLRVSENAAAEADAAASAAVEADPDNPLVLWWAAQCVSAELAPQRNRWLQRVADLGGTPDIANSAEMAREQLEVNRNIGDRQTDVLAKGTRGELPIVRTMNGMYGVNLPIAEGRKLTMLLDTGANGLMIPKSAQDALKAERIGQATAYAVGGKVALDRLLLESFSIGDVEFKSVLAIGSPNNALLGMNIFRNQVFVIDFQKKRIVVHADRAEFEKEWADALKDVAPVKFRLFKNSILADATFKCGDKQVAGAAFFDTGAALTLLAHSFASQWNRDAGIPLVDGGKVPVGGAAGARMTQIHRMSDITMQVGDTAFQWPSVPVMDFAAVSRSGLGMDFSAIVGIRELGARRFLIIDSPRRNLYIGPPL